MTNRHLTTKILGQMVLCGLAWSQAALEPRAARPSSTGNNAPVGTNTQAPVNQITDEKYLIGPGDIIAVNVWKEPDVSRAVPVRSDGRISLPLVGEVQASGVSPKGLEREIALRLQNYISDPEVTVIVQEMRSQRFNILGQVIKPGSYLLTGSTTVLDAIAMAGGFRDFAKQRSIYVLRVRPDGIQEKLPFNYKEVIKGSYSAKNVKLEPRDTVVVP
jgi:polysaccharide export outer membrane protein